MYNLKKPKQKHQLPLNICISIQINTHTDTGMQKPNKQAPKIKSVLLL